MNTWVSWFTSFFLSNSNSPKDSHHDLQLSLSLLNLSSGWNIIESDEDRQNATKAAQVAHERQQELEELRQLRAKMEISHDHWSEYFQRLLRALPAREITWLTVSLPADMRFSIINRVFKLRADEWLKIMISRAQLDGAPHSESEMLAILKRAWDETEFSKGHLGMLRDFVLLRYPEEGVTTELLTQLHKAITKGLLNLMESELHVHTISDGTRSIFMDAVSKSVMEIVALHVESAKNCSNTLKNEGVLPNQFLIESEIRKNAIESLKRKGAIDAKYVEKTKWTPSDGVWLTPDAQKAAQSQLALLYQPQSEKERTPDFDLVRIGSDEILRRADQLQSILML